MDNSSIATPPAAGIRDSAATAVETIESIHQRYAAEREKRLRSDASTQYINLAQSDRFRYLAEDPWVDHAALNAVESPLKDGSHTKVLVLGAGLGGILAAKRLLDNGVSRSDFCIADAAGGYGGAWYWNRFPGLACDIESYIYLPLLEETGFIPKHRYSYGPEIRAYAELLADHLQIRNRTSFRSQVRSLVWDEQESRWRVTLQQSRGPGDATNIQVTATFVVLGAGVLNSPQILRVDGIEDFKGHSFHTSRWDYAYTGGSPEQPNLEKLKDERVGIIGTGATAVQSIPELAKHAKELYVFQRTPASVDERGQRPTSPEVWRAQVASKKGWYEDRRWNFLQTTSNAQPAPAVNLVNDGWTTADGISALLGAPGKGNLKPEEVPAHVTGLYTMDLPRQQRIKARVDELVKDKSTAEKLKAWYPTWCKRPCFHDKYLQTFNRDNVVLVDTDGKGVERLTENAVVANGKEYPVDCLIMATGYRTPFAGSPNVKADVTVCGKGGQTLDEKWASGVGTLHGLISQGFPNLLWTGGSQCATDGNYTHAVDHYTRHIAYIIAEGLRRSGSGNVAVEPSKEAEEAWTGRILAGAMAYAPMMGCTPSYYNNEGEADKATTPEQQMKAARAAPWADGLISYVKVLEDWRAQGDMEGLVVTA